MSTTEPRTPESDETTALDAGGVVLRLAAGGLLLLGVVLAVLFLPFLQGVRDRFGDAEPSWLVVTAACQLLSMLSFVLALHATFSRRLPRRVALDIGLVEQGANVLLPTGGAGGIALGAVALGRAGLDPARVAVRSVALFLLTSAASIGTVILAGLFTAVGLLGGDRPLVAALVPGAAALAVALLFAALPLLPELGPREGRVLGAVSRGWGTVRTGVGEAMGLLRHPDPMLIAGALGYLWWDILSLAAAFQAFGGGAPAFGPFVIAYVVGQLGSLIPIPGGVGGTDGGLIGFMVLYGASGSAAAAAVLAFRVFQLGFPGVLGAVALSRLRRDIERVADLRRDLEAQAAAEASSSS